MITAILFTAFVSFTNQEFFTTVEDQVSDGYKWEYVGKQAPSGAPAITVKPENGEEFILFRLEK